MVVEPRVEPGPAPRADTGGEPLRREGPAKLTGAARFTADLVVPGCWTGLTVRSPIAHGRLLGIDRGGIDWGSVVVVTAADIPGTNVVACLTDDQPALAATEIRHVGEPIALVAAPEAALARAARESLTPRIAPLPAVLDLLAADKVCRELVLERGDVESALAAADLVVEGTYRTGYQEQLYLEPQVMLALPADDGGVEIHGSLQCPFSVREAVARALGLEDARVRVVQEETGGGFGGKEDYPSVIAVHAALLARASGHPVRIAYDRAEDLLATTKRHPSVVRHRTGVTRDGVLVAQDIEVVLDAGAYTTISPLVLNRAAVHAGGPYRCPNVRIRARAVLTNTAPNGAFRGFGGPQAEFAAELHMGRIAAATGLGPLEIRRRNAYRKGDVTPTGQVLREEPGALAVLEAAATAAGWHDDGERDGPRVDRGRPIRRGRGIALGWHGCGLGGSGERRLAGGVTVELTADGSVRALAGVVEMGQGARTVLGQVVAEALGIEPHEVEVVLGDTGQVPDSGPTVASRGTFMAGGMLARAATRLREAVEAATHRSFADSRVDDTVAHGPRVEHERFGDFPGLEFDDETYTGDAHAAFSWGCSVADVEVDTDTGEVRVRSVVAAVDAGRIVNRVLAEGQVEGGTLQAVGWATSEAVVMDAEGRRRTDRLSLYQVPTAIDAPAVTPVLVALPTTLVPHGAKGLGELPMITPAPAVVAAIEDATGATLDRIPATPDAVLEAILS